MKAEIHPNYEAATVHCGCGRSWETRSTKADLRIEICSECHPFFTGEQRIVDTAGRIERFRQRYKMPGDGAAAAAAESAAAAATSESDVGSGSSSD